MQITNISEAKSKLSFLIKKVEKTKEPIIIGRAGEPVAILSAITKNDIPRKLGGSWEGKVKTGEDFNDTDNDTLNSFYNSTIFPEKS